MDIAEPATWEDTESLLKEIMGGVKDAVDNGKATTEEIFERLSRMAYGCQHIMHDLVQEGGRMTPKQNLVPALADAQQKALEEMAYLNWRK